jgi:hypothetical protein
MTISSEPPDDRFCDLVMKGGITSGIVYPKAIAMLAEKYRFRSIGGTSAGAIAAAVTAAAEYRRRCIGTRAGFDTLAALPDELKARVPGTKRSKLLSLFQPQPSMRRLFAVLINALNSPGTFDRILAIAGGLLRSYWIATVVCIIVTGAAYGAGLDLVGCLLLLLVALVSSISGWVYVDVTRALVANGYGMCTGLTTDPANPALTPWLNELIQRTAGLPRNGTPLTFGMLWDAPGFPPPWLHVAEGTTTRSIDLQMFSTNLGHGRPYIFPLPEVDASQSHFRDRDRLFFCAQELARYLPAEVMDWMERKGTPYTADVGREGKDPPTEEALALGLLELPPARDFPIILAARMSLSFPLLFAAVPLWAIDFDPPPGQRHFRRCWFSDGGISSNFPMHLFDGLVPSWPTFGIDLEPKFAGREMVFLPLDYSQGYGERWDNFDAARASASRFGGFLSAIVGTMQNWNDNSLARMPGVRDRIARVRLNPDEGGLNLNMDAAIIDKVAKRGQDAATKLISRFFDAPTPGSHAEGWDEQRFVRLCVLLKMLEFRAPGVMNALEGNCAHATGYDSLISRWTQRGEAADNAPPPGFDAPLSSAQAEALRAVIRELERLSIAMAEPSNATAFRPVPNPELRVRPPL